MNRREFVASLAAIFAFPKEAMKKRHVWTPTSTSTVVETGIKYTADAYGRSEVDDLLKKEILRINHARQQALAEDLFG